ncbi:CHAT domain-containing protein [Streptomyces sp. BE133]|uniref:CHAT domain-containing protein n=1 Tax=Streptomyces sp. BE133 TaxID=3002523 RepID=UPI002E7675FD|nr:CHAT domain-containing protein [Streptomyces sp. BE133]MEE1810141.1 CHAT domain-containing protein [Streptomyces sp. BE133]
MTTQDQDELMADLRRIGLDGSFAAVVMKKESFSAIGIGAPVLVLPSSVLMSGLRGGNFSEELLTEGVRQAVAALRRVEPTAVLAESLLSLSRASAGGEAPEQRLGIVVEAIAVLRQVGKPHRLPRAYVALSNVLSEMGRHYDALAALDRAADAERDYSDAGALLAIHFGRATIFRGLGLQTEALSELHHADRALSAIEPETSDKLWAKRIRSETMFCLSELGRVEAALAKADAWSATDPEGSLFTPAVVRADLVSRRSGAAAAAEDYLEAAIRAAADISTYSSARFRRRARDRYDSLFARSITALIEARQHASAFAVWELARSGSALLPRDSDAYESALSTGVRDEIEAEASRLVGHARDALATGDRSALATCQEQADWILFRNDMLGRIPQARAASRELVDAQMADLRRAITPGTLLVSYAAIGEHVYVFAVTSESVVCEQLATPRLELRLLAMSAARECRDLLPTDALDESARRLLAPVGHLIEKATAIVVVPCAELQGLPFHAMHPFRGKAVTYSTRATDLRAGMSREERPLKATSSWTGLGTPSVPYSALPELTYVREELQAIGAHFRSPNIVLDPGAASPDLLDVAARNDILHIACHAAFEPGAPHLSRLLLADRPVFAFEMALAPLNAAHVVLSACETADAAAHQGGHTQSLASAFLTAGASGVTGSLWPVNDRATARFLTTLYEHRISTGASMSDALGWTRSVFAEETSHPHYWAPFVHIGVQRADR